MALYGIPHRLLHAWYLDDGVLAGPRSALLRVVLLLQQDGPTLGLFINVGKCEIYSHNHLEGFPEQIVKSNNACFVILGIPIGDAEFCASFISSKRVGSKLLLDKLEEVGAIDPHVALILIRLCGGFCCLNHFARATPPPHPFHLRLCNCLMRIFAGVSHQLLALMHRMLPGNRPNLA